MIAIRAAAVVAAVPRVCCRCGKPSVPEQTEAARRRPYVCPPCLLYFAERPFAPRWVNEALYEASADQGGAP